MLGWMVWVIAAFGLSEYARALAQERQPKQAGVSTFVAMVILGIGLWKAIIWAMLI